MKHNKNSSLSKAQPKHQIKASTTTQARNNCNANAEFSHDCCTTAHTYSLEITTIKMQNFHTTHLTSPQKPAWFKLSTHSVYHIETQAAWPKQRHKVRNSHNKNMEFSHSGWSFFLHEKLTKYLVL